MSQSKPLGVVPQTLESVPDNTTLMNPLSGMSAVWADDVVEMMPKYICANATLTAPQTGANGANVSAEIFV